MSASVVIPLSGLPGVLGDVARDAQPQDLKPLLSAMGLYLSSQAKRRFDQQAAPDGVAWLPLKRQRSRKRDKAGKKLPGGKKQGGQKVLRDTGLMMNSLTAQAGGARGGVYRMTETTLEQGTNIHYAPYHQFGTRTIPARPFVGVNDKGADRLAQIAADYFSKGKT